MTDFLAEKRQELESRLKELQPHVDEYNRVKAAAEALAALPGATNGASATPRRRGPGRPRGSVNKPGAAKPAKAKAAKAKATRAKAAGKRAGRRKGSGTRALEALGFVQGQPGITIPELAAKMGIKQNYLYRVLPALEQESRVKKEGRGWHPVA